MQVWSPHGDSLLSPDDVEKAVREGIENIPVTDHVMEDEDIILRDDPDDSQDDNEDLAAGDSVNSPRLDNNVAVTSDDGQQAFQSEKLADDNSDSDDGISDDMTDQSDEGLSYRELLIITLSSSVLIILIILISVLSLLHSRHRDKCLHSLGHPDLIPGPGSGSGAASVSGTVLTPHLQQSKLFLSKVFRPMDHPNLNTAERETSNDTGSLCKMCLISLTGAKIIVSMTTHPQF